MVNLAFFSKAELPHGSSIMLVSAGSKFHAIKL